MQARALDRSARSGRRSAVLLIDLNGFKQINDTLGHQVGDGLLTAVAAAMRRCVRGADLIGRLGGDELLWTPALDNASFGDESLAADLGRAVAAGQLSLRYQPVVDVVSGEIAGVEARARWHHPVRGELGPDVFIPIAERTGAIDEIGRWVLEEAATQARRWRRSGRTPYLSIRLSPRQLDRPDLVPAVRAILDRAGLDPRQLVLELTENALVPEKRLRALRDLGIRVGQDHRLAHPLTADAIADLVAAGDAVARSAGD
jgi:predicted signal transduction protein with EAL and GGDEF domain